MTHFGAFIRELRTINGYSLRKFAKLVGVSATCISMFEQGKTEIGEEKIKVIADILDQNADQLIAMAGRVPSKLVPIITAKIQRDPDNFINELMKINNQ